MYIYMYSLICEIDQYYIVFCKLFINCLVFKPESSIYKFWEVGQALSLYPQYKMRARIVDTILKLSKGLNKLIFIYVFI